MKKDKIILYEANETIFSHNGICILRPISCFINRSLIEYGYDLDMTYPIDDGERWKELKEDRIIKANGQLFRIVYINKSVIESTIEVYAKHIFFDLQRNFIEGTNVVSKNGNTALGQLLGATSYQHNFTGYSDIATVSNLNCTRKNVLDALIGDENSFINRWQGEFDVDNFNLKFMEQVGEDRGYKIKYGKNLTGLTVKTDFMEIVTRIRPIGFDGIELPDGNKYVDSANINNYSMPIIKEFKYENVKWTGSLNYKEEENDASTIFNDLSLAQAELRRLATLEFTDNEVDLPKVTCEINFVDLSTTEEYAHFQNLTKVSLGDIVTIEHLPLGIHMKARCISYKYDCLKEEYEEITIGHYVKNFFTETTNTNNKLENVDTNISEEIQSVYAQAVEKMTELMNKGLNGYVVVNNNEILIMDTEDKTTAKNVWRFNSAGIAFSSTGYNGDFIVGMTMDGHINGALITAGSINADMLEAGTITTRELAVEIQETIRGAMTEENTQAMITANLNQFESNLSQTFITQENASKQIQDATEVAVQEATSSIVGSAVEQAMQNVNDQLGNKLNEYTTDVLTPTLQDAMANTLNTSKEYVVQVIADYYTKEETNSIISQTREQIELGVSTTYETKESATVKIGEAVNGITVGATNRVFGTATGKSYRFTGISNDIWTAYDISPDISNKDVVVSFEYDINAVFQIGATLKFQSQYLSTSNVVTYSPTYEFINSDTYQIINKTGQKVSFNARWDSLQQDAKFRFRADGVTGDFTIRKAQIKVGNKITEWSIAPEDIETNANIYTINQLLNYYTKQQTDSRINVLKDEINLNVSSTYETKQGVETTINGVYNTINNIKIGGTNLLLGTDEAKTIKGNNNKEQSVNLYDVINNDEHFCDLETGEFVLSFDYEFVDGASGSFKIQTDGRFDASLGEQSDYTVDLSDMINFSQSGATTTTTIYELVDENGNNIVDENENIIADINITTIGTSFKGHASKVVTLTENATKGFKGVKLVGKNLTGNVIISRMKLEKGNKETDWCDSSEDIKGYTNSKLTEYYTKTETDSRIDILRDEINISVSTTYTKTEVDKMLGDVNQTIYNMEEQIKSGEIFISDEAIISAVGEYVSKEIGKVDSATRSYFEGIADDIHAEMNGLSSMVSNNIGSDALTSQMKVKLVSEYKDALATYNKIKSMYAELGDSSFNNLITSLNTAQSELASVINTINSTITTTDETGLANVLTKFNAFYDIAETLSEAIINSVTINTKETKTEVTQLKDSYNIAISQIEGVQGNINTVMTSFNFASDGLTIKSSANASKYIKLDNDSLDFIDGGSIVAQISNSSLLITDAQVLNQLIIGNIKIHPSGKGGLMFTYQ